MRKQIAVIGSGFVGTMVGQRILEKGLADVVLVDIMEGIARGKALDIAQGLPVLECDGHIEGTHDFSMIRGSQIVVVTAGFPRTPGMTREDLVRKNGDVILSVMDQVGAHAPEAIVIVVTNPLDVMAHLAWKRSGFPAERVFGMGGILDEARFRFFLSRELGVSPNDIQALVLGSHGETMVPVKRYTSVRGVPIDRFMTPERFADIVERTRQGGAEIVGLLKSGSAWHAPSASTIVMIEAILNDSKRMVAASALLQGHYDIMDIHIGVPVILGAGGIETICEIPLDDADSAALRQAAKSARDMVDSFLSGSHA